MDGKSGGSSHQGRAIRWVLISCWCGAVTDLLALIGMVFPSVGAKVYGLNGYRPGADFTYAMDSAAALMLGWTLLLIWAARRPLERKGVLVLTVCPVIAGLVLGEIAAIRSGFLPFLNVVPTFVLQLALTALFLYSYALAGAASAGSR